MPELPEVEQVRRTLGPSLIGARVLRVRVHRADVISHSMPAASARFDRRRLLVGATIARLRRHGKNLAVISQAGPALNIHLGMSGQLRFVPAGSPLESVDHIHVQWTIESRGGRGRLIFRDPRRFGGIWTHASFSHLRKNQWQLLGPDALGISVEYLEPAFAKTNRSIKAVLLDQHVLAGLGNIYVDESLFAAQIHPLTIASTLSSNRVKRLTQSIETVLRGAIKAGGSTVRSFSDGNGRWGAYAAQHRVYGRAGLPCVYCGLPLQGLTVGQRTTTLCRRCQEP